MTRAELWEAFGRRRGTLFPLTGKPRYQCRLNVPSCEGFADIPEAAIAAALGVEWEEPKPMPDALTLEQAVAELEEARRLAEAAAGRPEMYALPFECAFLAGQIKGIKSALSIFRRVVPEDTRLRAMADDQKEAGKAEANEA